MTLESTYNFLLADDDKDDCLLFQEALEESGVDCTLRTVYDGDQLISHLHTPHQIKPDIIFLDIDMPCKNGIDCLEEIKDSPKLRSIPVVILSTHSQPTTVKEAYLKKAQFYIKKPNSFAALKNAIQSILQTIWSFSPE